ncbi:hypothetical protein D9M71_365960 [compost metagenome]
MTGQTGTGVTARRCGQRLMNAEGFFAATVSLARHVDDGDQGAFAGLALIGGDDFIHGLGQAPAFEQPHFAIACTDEAVFRVGHHCDETHRLIAQRTVRDLQRSRQAFDRFRPGTQGVEPVQTTQGIRAHGRSPWYRSRTTDGSICGSASRRARRCRNSSA